MKGLLLGMVVVFGGCGGDDDVAEEFDASAPSVDASTEDPTEAIFDPDRLLEVEVELAPEDWDTLRFEHKDFYGLLIDNCPGMHPPRAYNYQVGTVTIDGEVVETVGIRKKGFLGSVTPARPSLKLSFDEYVDGRRFSGLRRMTLNNNLQDESKMSTCLSLKMFRAMGVPAPRCNHARVTVNGKYLGVYSHVESIKKPFLERHFGTSDGNLYEGTVADFRPMWVDMYETKPIGDGNRADLAAVVTALQADDASLLTELDPLVDIDSFLTFWAAELIVGHWDGYNGNRNNHYIYRHPETNKFHWMPWSPDDGFGQLNPFLNYDPPASVWANNQLSQRLYALPEVRDMYQARLQQLLDDVWDEAEVLAEIDRIEALVRPHLIVGQGQFEGRAQATRDYVERIRTDIEDSLAQDPDWEATLPESFCLETTGTITATFSGPYGSFPAIAPFSVGTSTLNFQFEGKAPQVFTDFGLAIGTDGDPSNPKTVIMVFGLKPDTSVMFPFLAVDPELFETPQVLQVDLYEVFGVFLDEIAPDDYDFTGFVRGTLTLDEVSTTIGGTVSGSLDVELVSRRAFE